MREGSIDDVVSLALRSVLCDEEGTPAPYHPESIDQWSSDVIEFISSTLQKSPFFQSKKIIVHVVFCQATGAGLHASTGAVWDTQHDFHIMCKYTNASVDCVTTVYVLANPTPPAFEIPIPTNH